MQKTSRKLKRGEEGEQLVSNELDRDPSFHRLINNLVLLGDNNVSHQIDHILIRENGIFVIETKNHYGKITGLEDDSYWKKTFFVKGKIKTETFHNPLKQNQSHIRIIKRVIGKDGRTINSVRTILAASSSLHDHKYINLNIEGF